MESYDRLISTMGFPILVRQHFYIKSGSWSIIYYIQCNNGRWRDERWNLDKARKPQKTSNSSLLWVLGRNQNRHWGELWGVSSEYIWENQMCYKTCYDATLLCDKYSFPHCADGNLLLGWNITSHPDTANSGDRLVWFSQRTEPYIIQGKQ